MDEKLRSQIAAGLYESFKHKKMDGVECAICQKSGKNIATHVIKYAQSDIEKLPVYFVPLSQSRGTIRGGFALCEDCAPPCPKCGLPVPNKKVKSKFVELESLYKTPTTSLLWGNGKCKHTWLFGRWPL